MQRSEHLPFLNFPVVRALPGLVLLSGFLLSAGCASTEGWTTAVDLEEPEPTSPQSDDEPDESSEDLSDESDEVEEEEAGNEEEEDNPPEEEVEETPEFELTAGSWVVTESELTEDGCNLTDQVDRGTPGSVMDLLPTATDSFDLTFASDGQVTHCAMETEPNFDCQSYSGTDERASDYGLDATILVDRESSGSFSSAEELVLISDVFLECQGPDCTWVNLLLGSNFPCSVAMESRFSLQDPSMAEVQSVGSLLGDD